MDTNTPANDQTTPPADANPPVQIQEDGNSGDLDYWKSEAEKWKGFSRKHESNWEKATRELDGLRKAGMTDAERAIEEAREQGRQEVRTSSVTERAQLKLEAAAARAGVDLTPVQALLDTSKFIANGDVNDAAINEFVTGYAGGQPKAPKFAQGLGIGPQSDSRTPGQLTREEFARLSPRERVQARKDGRADALLRGEI
ncbi:hypothetical protein [Nonomuraea sp. NPDC049129]|uniref:hypothetical protein n=1 Tax=Nonomuraea sp. NPDC049129 TaxID=3155272 RepID=UPI0033EB5EAB